MMKTYINKLLEIEKESTFDVDQLEIWIKALKKADYQCPCQLNGIKAGDLNCPEEYNYEIKRIDSDYYCMFECRRSLLWNKIKRCSNRIGRLYLIEELKKLL